MRTQEEIIGKIESLRSQADQYEKTLDFGVDPTQRIEAGARAIKCLSNINLLHWVLGADK